MSTTDNTPNDHTTHDDTLTDEVFTDTAPEPGAPTAARTTALPVSPADEPTTTDAPAAAPASGPITTTSPTTGTTAGTATAGAPGGTNGTATGDGPWLQGPAPFAIVLGLLGLLTAGAVLVNELTDVTFPWADLGPWSVVAAGLVVVLVGAIGLRTSRRTQA